jgi:hypothetical protein
MLPQQGAKSGFVTMMLAIGPAIFGGCGIWQRIDIISIVTGKSM